MGVHFTNIAWQQYLDWQQVDKKTLKKINLLLKSIQINGLDAIGKIEPLKGDLSGLHSARIDVKNRLVFYIEGANVVVASCSGHY